MKGERRLCAASKGTQTEEVYKIEALSKAASKYTHAHTHTHVAGR